MRKRLITLIGILLAVPAWGQVIVPALDPTLPAELASAVAWRIGSTIGLESEFYNQKEDASNDAGTESTRTAVLLAYQPGNFITEIYYAPFIKTATAIDEQSSTVTWEDKKATEFALRVAIRGNRRVSVGIGYERQEIEESGEKFSTSLFEGSFSVRLLEGLLYTGGGMQRVTIEQGSEDSIKFNTLIAGVAIQIGDPLAMIFQMEAAMKQTPETDSEDGLIATMPKTTVSQLNSEFHSGRFFLAYRYRQTMKEEYLPDENYTETLNRYGAGLKLGNWTIGLYRKAWKAEFMEEISEYDTYSLTAGYSFL
jgi:hypothetical protein